MKLSRKSIWITSCIIFCILGFSLFSFSYQSNKANLPDLAQKQTETWSDIAQENCFSDPNIQFFMYHYIRDHEPKEPATTHELSVAPGLFEEHMKMIRDMTTKWEITLMRGDDFLRALSTKCFPGKDIWIFTADDGWIDMRDNLVPIATKYRVPFFLWIITGKLDVKGFVSREDVVNFSKNSLMSISSHSVNHVNNAKLDFTGETSEMCDSKKTLEAIVWSPVSTYIYPSGRINPIIDIDVAQKCGYRLAWSTSFGSDYNEHTGSIYDLNRVRVHADTSPDFFEKLYKKIHRSTETLAITNTWILKDASGTHLTRE